MTQLRFQRGMKNHFRHILCAVIFILCVFTLHAAASRSGTAGSTARYDYRNANVGNAFTALTDTFGFRESGEPIYPDSYCGAWKDGDCLVIGLTDISEEITSEYDKKIGTVCSAVRYVKMTYSRKEIRDYLVSTASLIAEKLQIAVSGLAISDKENIGIIGVEREEERIAVLASGLIDGLPLVVKIIPITELLSTNVSGGDHLFVECWI